MKIGHLSTAIFFTLSPFCPKFYYGQMSLNKSLGSSLFEAQRSKGDTRSVLCVRGQDNTCTSLVIASTTGSPIEQDWVQTSRPAWVWASPGQSWAPRQNVDSLWLRQNSKKSILLMLIERSDWFWTDQSINHCCPMIVEKPGQLHRFPSTVWLSILGWLSGWLIINSSHSTNQLQCDCQEFSLRCCVCVID